MKILKIIGIVVALLIVALIALPFVIDANTFRPKLETELTDALGRQVKVGNISLSLLSGGVTADNISIADDPKFSALPFVQAKSLKVGVEMMPLIFSKALHVTELTLTEPQISLVKSQDGDKWNFSSIGTKTSPAEGPAPSQPSSAATQSSNAPSTSSENPNLSVAKLNVDNGRLTVSRADSTEKERVYDKVNVQVTNFSFASSFPFEMSANLPSEGSLKLSGKAGPINAGNAQLTPLDAKITVQKMNLSTSGFLDPAAGIAGIADLDGSLASDGHEAKVDGALKASNLKVVPKGTPATQPVNLAFAIVHNLVKETGEITKGDLSMGKAVAHLTGSFNAHGKITTVNLKLNGQNMPVDDLEAMLPAVGVILPPKATLKGGDLDITMTSVGAVDKLVTTGTVRLQNTQLANFNLGQKMAAISALGGKTTGNDTSIQNFSSDVRNSPEGTVANNINLTIPAIGVLTGAGTVNPSNELAFKMKADVGGMGIPFGVTGTTADPKFTPDVKGLATGLLGSLLSGQQGDNKQKQQQQSPLNNVMGLFKKKQ